MWTIYILQSDKKTGYLKYTKTAPVALLVWKIWLFNFYININLAFTRDVHPLLNYLLPFMSGWSYDQNIPVDVAYLDFQKAFDSTSLGLRFS